LSWFELLKYYLYDWKGLNTELFIYLNGSFANSENLHKFISYFNLLGTTYGVISIWIGIIIISSLYLFINRNRLHETYIDEFANKWADIAIIIICSAILMYVLLPLVKEYFNFSRPMCVFAKNQINIILEYGNSFEEMFKKRCLSKDSSFPSAHSAIATMLVTSFWYISRNIYLRIFFLLVVLMAGFSRIATGVHFPADILSGYLFGFATVVFTRKAINKIKSLLGFDSKLLFPFLK